MFNENLQLKPKYKNFSHSRPRQAKEFKISFTKSQLLLAISLLFSSGISVGVTIMLQ